MLDPEAQDWESIYQCPRKQAGQIPPHFLKAWGEFVSDSSLCITEALFAWPFRVAVASGLRWGDLLSNAPATTVLMEECHIGFAAKTKTMGKSDGRPCGDSNFSFPNENLLSAGLLLFRENTRD